MSSVLRHLARVIHDSSWGAFGGAASFLGIIGAGVWWASLASQRRARALDDRLDRELDIEDDARGNDRREPPAV